MKLAEIIESEAPYTKAQKRNCLTLQSALSHEWGTKIRPPDVPIDTETGEIHPWTLTAVNDDDKNVMRFKVSPFGASNDFGWTSDQIDDDDALKDDFDEWYVNALSQQVEDFQWKFDGDLETYLKSTVLSFHRDIHATPGKRSEPGPSAIADAFKDLESRICNSFIEEWRDHNHVKIVASFGSMLNLELVNSPALELKQIAAIKELFVECFNERLKKEFPNASTYKPA